MKDNITNLVITLIIFFGGIYLCMHDYPTLGGLMCIISAGSGWNAYDRKP